MTRAARRLGRRLLAGPPDVLTAEHVRWAYRLFLDREAEAPEVIAEKLAMFKSTHGLRHDLLASGEYRSKNAMKSDRDGQLVVIKELSWGPRIFIDLADQVIGAGILENLYEVDELAFVRRVVEPGQNVLDVGANIGLYAVTLAQLVGAHGHVHAFEPLARNADLLDRSIVENGYRDRFHLERAAVGETAGTMELVSPQQSTHWGGAYLRAAKTPLPPGHAATPVPVVRLDDVVLRRPVRFIKIDIEGAEPLALRGARRLLVEDRPLVLAELSPALLAKVSGSAATELIDELAALDYDCLLLAAGDQPRRIRRYSGRNPVSVVFVPRETAGDALLAG